MATAGLFHSQFKKKTHSAKSGNDWTMHDLTAYNISVKHQDTVTFFGTHNLPQPENTAVLTVINADDTLGLAPAQAHVAELLCLMDLAMSPAPEGGSFVCDFTVLLLRVLGYSQGGRLVKTRMDTPLVICGENRHVQMDMYVIQADESNICLIVQEDKQPSDPEPQLIAGAIAVFADNNITCQQALNLPPLSSKVMAGIIVKGTMPTFYKIRVTTTLVASVASGIYPQEATIVHTHIPDIPRSIRGTSRCEAMKLLENRQAILACYEAFKQFIE